MERRKFLGGAIASVFGAVALPKATEGEVRPKVRRDNTGPVTKDQLAKRWENYSYTITLGETDEYVLNLVDKPGIWTLRNFRVTLIQPNDVETRIRFQTVGGQPVSTVNGETVVVHRNSITIISGFFDGSGWYVADAELMTVPSQELG